MMFKRSLALCDFLHRGVGSLRRAQFASSSAWRAAAGLVIAIASLGTINAAAQTVDLVYNRNINPAVLLVGQTTSYTIRIASNGPSAVTNAPFTEVLPPGFRALSTSCTATGGATCGTIAIQGASATGQTVAGTAANLPKFGAITVTINGEAPLTEGNYVFNGAVTPPSGTSELIADTNNVQSNILVRKIYVDLATDVKVFWQGGPAAGASTWPVNNDNPIPYPVRVRYILKNNGPDPVSGAKTFAFASSATDYLALVAAHRASPTATVSAPAGTSPKTIFVLPMVCVAVTGGVTCPNGLNNPIYSVSEERSGVGGRQDIPSLLGGWMLSAPLVPTTKNVSNNAGVIAALTQADQNRNPLFGQTLNPGDSMTFEMTLDASASPDILQSIGFQAYNPESFSSCGQDGIAQSYVNTDASPIKAGILSPSVIDIATGNNVSNHFHTATRTCAVADIRVTIPDSDNTLWTNAIGPALNQPYIFTFDVENLTAPGGYVVKQFQMGGQVVRWNRVPGFTQNIACTASGGAVCPPQSIIDTAFRSNMDNATGQLTSFALPGGGKLRFTYTGNTGAPSCNVFGPTGTYVNGMVVFMGAPTSNFGLGFYDTNYATSGFQINGNGGRGAGPGQGHGNNSYGAAVNFQWPGCTGGVSYDLSTTKRGPLDAAGNVLTTLVPGQRAYYEITGRNDDTTQTLQNVLLSDTGYPNTFAPAQSTYTTGVLFAPNAILGPFVKHPGDPAGLLNSNGNRSFDTGIRCVAQSNGGICPTDVVVSTFNTNAPTNDPAFPASDNYIKFGATIPSLPPQATITLRVPYIVRELDSPCGGDTVYDRNTVSIGAQASTQLFVGGVVQADFPANYTERDPTDNSDYRTAQIVRPACTAPQIAIDKAFVAPSSATSFEPDGTVRYTVKLKNPDPALAYDIVRFTDTPKIVCDAAFTGQCATLTPSSVTCGGATGGATCPSGAIPFDLQKFANGNTAALVAGSLGRIDIAWGTLSNFATFPAGGEVTMTITYKIKVLNTYFDRLDNVATWAAIGVAKVGPVSDSVTTSLPKVGRLTMNKVIDVPSQTGGGTVTYTIEVYNGTVYDVPAGARLTDPIPTGLTQFTAITCAPITGAPLVGTAGLPIGAVGCPTITSQTAALDVTLGILPKNSGLRFTLTAIAPTANTSIRNDATLDVSTPTPSEARILSNANFHVPLSFALGNRVWMDVNGNGTLDATEAGIDGVKLDLLDGTGAKLYRTSASDQTPTTTVTAFPIEATTANGGYYLFEGLPQASYRVRVVASNFAAGGALLDKISSPGVTNVSGVPTAAQNNRDHGVDPATLAAYATSGVQSNTIALSAATVGTGDTTETGNPVGTPPTSGAGDANDNQTVDFGFMASQYDLTIAKTVTSAGPYTAGVSTVTYSLVATNNGPAAAQAAIVVKDKLPAGLTAVSATGTNWTCTPQTGAAVEIVCTRATAAGVLASGASATAITVTASIDATATGALVNRAQVNPSATETLTESNPLGTTNGGYDDGSASTGSNNDDSKSITVGANTYSLGNRVWNDNGAGGGIAGDGLQNGTEPGVDGVTVALLNGTTNAVIGSSVATAGGGYYRFDNLPAGDYKVRITKPAGFVNAAIPASGATPNNDTDRDNNGFTETASTVTSNVVTLGPLLSEPTNEADLVGGAAAGNAAANGGVDALGNMTVDFGLVQRIDLSLVKTVTSTGPYTAGVSTVTYSLVATNNGPAAAQAAIVVKDKLPAGLTAVSATGTNWTCTPQTGAAVEIVCTRATAAGVLASGASATAITVTASIDATATGALVNRAQVNPSATETLTESNPLGTTNGGYDDGSASTGSNNDDSKSITVGAATYSIGNRVWNDLNNNGVLDVGEVGLPGVTVTLLDAANVPVAGVAPIVTESNGYYRFDGLPEGSYVVQIAPPAVNGVTYVSSTGQNGSAIGPYESGIPGAAAMTNNKDHGTQTTPTTIRSATITLGLSNPVTNDVDAGSTGVGTNGPNGDAFDVLTVDFGVFLPAKLGNLVWADTNKDGKADPDEVGLNGVTVILRDANGAEIVRQVTRNNPTAGTPGFYQFDYLIAGQYKVEFVSQNYLSTSSGTPAITAGSGADTNNSQLQPGLNSGMTQLVILGAGDNNPQLDAGFITTVAPVPTLSGVMKLIAVFMMLFVGLTAMRRR
jgi:uncharacterized repeat protein (TIGR01451 family)